MFDGRDFDEAERKVDDWQAGIELRAEQAREFVARMEGLSVTARSDDELVTVTVGAGGDLTGLELDERIRERSAEETAREILATMRAAQARLTAAVEQVTAEVIGIDSATGQAIVGSYRNRLGGSDG